MLVFFRGLFVRRFKLSEIVLRYCSTRYSGKSEQYIDECHSISLLFWSTIAPTRALYSSASHKSNALYALYPCKIGIPVLGIFNQKKVKKKGPLSKSLKKILCRIKRGLDRRANSICRRAVDYQFLNIFAQRQKY